MRFLLVTGGFAGPGRQPWLMDDLAEALVNAGHSVDVIVGDPKTPRAAGEQRAENPRITLFSVGPRKKTSGALGRLIGHIRVGLGLHTRAYSWVRHRSYDVCVSTSPASFSWGFPRRIRSAGVSRRNVLFLWDFFPIHQMEIGRINIPWLARPMKALERKAIDAADVVAVMSPANRSFFLRYHRGATNSTIEIPPWSSTKPLIDRTASEEGPLRVVFGGQIAKGRGVDTLVDAAALLQERAADVQILVAGDGPERSALERRAAAHGLTNIEFLGALPREHYRELARSAHVGIAITVPGISPPSFPSKIVEYCSLGIPVLVCVEDSSDAGEFVAVNGAGVSVPAGDALALATAIGELERSIEDGGLSTMSVAARRLFDARLSAERVVEALERIVPEGDDAD